MLHELYNVAQELNCIAQNVYYEARGEPIEGQLAVANVTLNRAEDGRWPSSACDVVHQPNQFSWVSHKQKRPEGQEWTIAQVVAITVYILPDPTQGATHFHANYVKPYWAKGKKVLAKIGDHIFYA